MRGRGLQIGSRWVVGVLAAATVGLVIAPLPAAEGAEIQPREERLSFVVPIEDNRERADIDVTV